MKWQAYKLVLIIFLAVVACGKPAHEDNFEDCEYLAPEAIFSSHVDGISNHRFSLQGQKSQESFDLPNGVTLSILQSGCHFRQQDFRFALPTKLEPSGNDPHFWLAQLIEQLNLLSELGPEFLTFRNWAKAMAKKADEIQVGDTVALQEGFYIKIDHDQADGHTILMLTLSDQP